MVITYTRIELEEALHSLEKSINLNRKLYVQSGSSYTAEQIAKETSRKDFLKLELMKDQKTFNL